MNKQRIEDGYSVFKKSVGKLSEDQRRVYTDGLVLWLGVYQALEYASCRGSLEELGSERSFALYGDCARKWSGGLSCNSGALIQARQNIELETLQESVNTLYEYVRKGHLWNGYRVIGVDGSTVSLNKSTPKLLKAYPGGQDHKGKSRWPLVHLVLLIDLLESTVVTANLGAKYGKKAESEQSLAVELIDFVKEKAIIVGDRNYGTFHMAKEYLEHGTEVLLRLSNPVADSLASSRALSDGLDMEVTWRPSTQVRNKYGYEKHEQVNGRLVVSKFKYRGKVTQINLFTTLSIGTVEELIKLYKKRWMLEEDIKTMKQQLRLKNVQAETKAAVDVEIFCKLLAFTLTRGVVLMALEGTDINPRRISFSLAFLITRTKLQEYSAQKNSADKQKTLDFMLERIRNARIPERPGRSYPRQAYGRRPARYQVKSSRL